MTAAPLKATFVAEVERFMAPGTDNEQFLLHDGHRTLIVDPRSATGLRRLTRAGRIPVGVLLTHTHWDHIDGLPYVLEAHPEIPVYVHAAGIADLPPGARTVVVGEGARIPFGPGDVVVRETPGHHPAHVIFHWGDVLLVGDVLFCGGCGRPFGPEHMAATGRAILDVVAPADDALRLAWGHDYAADNLAWAAMVEPGNVAIAGLAAEAAARAERGEMQPWRTLADERAVNPFLRTGEATVRDGLARSGRLSGTTPDEIFAALRRWRSEA